MTQRISVPASQRSSVPAEALITARQLVKSFGAIHAVDGVSLSVQAGEIYGLVGADGAGKTTTLRLLVGALRPEAGEAAIGGVSVLHHPERARQYLGYLSQRFSLYEDLTVLENIRFFAEVRGLKREEWLKRSLEILDFVGLTAFKDRRAAQLSGGMKQKLGLATALVTRPQVLLLDEPTTGVDPLTRQDFWQLIVRLITEPLGDSETGASRRGVLLTTPYLDEAARCTRVGFMRAGRIVAEGTPSELRAPLQGRVLELHASHLPTARQLVAPLEGVEDVHAFGSCLHLRLATGKASAVTDAIHRLAAAHPALGLSVRPVLPSLEDVFIALSEA